MNLLNTRVLFSLLLIMGLCLNSYKFQNNEDEDEENGEETNQDEETSGNGLPNNNNNDVDTESLKTERIVQPTRQSLVQTTATVNLDDTVNDQQALDDISDANDDDEDTNDENEEDEEESNDSNQVDDEKDVEQVKQLILDVSSTIVTPPFKSSRSKLLAIISKPGILAGIVGGAIIGILTAILLIMFIVYRMRKKDEGSYALEETKKPLNAYDYRHCPTKEFYA